LDLRELRIWLSQWLRVRGYGYFILREELGFKGIEDMVEPMVARERECVKDRLPEKNYTMMRL